MKPGEAVVTYECEGVTVGCAICYDLRFPGAVPGAGGPGAQVIALPAAFTLATGKDHWDVLCRARAIETETYFCAPAPDRHLRAGQRDTRHLRALARRRPWGLVVARASDGVGYVAARIDPTRVAKVRAQMIPVAQHKRPLR